MTEFIIFDFETNGLDPVRSSIKSFGALAFNPETVMDDITNSQNGMYVNIREESNAEVDRVSDPSTVEWWNNQSSSAKAIFTSSDYPLIDAAELPGYFAEFCKPLYEKDKTLFLCRGTHFDYKFMESLASKVKVQVPIKYFNVLDVRSMINALGYKDIKSGRIKNDGYGYLKEMEWIKDLNLIPHFALSDCIRDAVLLSSSLGRSGQLEQ